MYVYRIENGEKVMTDVVTGMSDGVYTEILSGVSVGDEISLSKVQFRMERTRRRFRLEVFPLLLRRVGLSNARLLML